MTLDPVRLARAKRLRADFPFFARHCLKVKNKAGKLVPLQLNEAQLYLHERIERQRARTGRVRIIVLKGRQQGASTYVEGRFYWRTATRKGVQTVVIAHEDKASTNLFKMAKRYHDGMPADVRPSTKASNAKELVFGRLDSGYMVLTAGTKAVGRGNTAQLLHASEFAFWKDAAEHMAGIAQAVADEDETEIIIESTAKGMGNEFHRKVQLARAGKGEYELVFIPWFWTSEYKRPVPEGWVRTQREQELVELFGLSDEQLAFRRHKIETDFAGDDVKFLEEYPCTPDEAFQAENRETFVPLRSVLTARACVLPEPSRGPVLLGVDPARFGDDRTGLCWRRGREVLKLEAKSKLDTMQVAGLVVKAFKEGVAFAFVDVVGLGAGVVDRLRELGFGDRTIAVNGGSTPIEPERYRNKRAECWGRMREWLAEPPVSIPDADVLQADLLAPGYHYDSHSRYVLESKEDIKARGGASPDLGDALALTFAEDVQIESPENTEPDTVRADRVGGY